MIGGTVGGGGVPVAGRRVIERESGLVFACAIVTIIIVTVVIGGLAWVKVDLGPCLTGSQLTARRPGPAPTVCDRVYPDEYNDGYGKAVFITWTI